MYVLGGAFWAIETRNVTENKRAQKLFRSHCNNTGNFLHVAHAQNLNSPSCASSSKPVSSSNSNSGSSTLTVESYLPVD